MVERKLTAEDFGLLPITTQEKIAWTAKQDALPSKTGNANKYLKVNATEDGFEYDTPSGGSGLTQAQVLARNLGC